MNLCNEECRVCREGSTEGRPLFHPCKCDGSIKYVHQDCLLQWLRVSRQHEPRCELCNEKIEFRRIYATSGDKPPSLGFVEFISGLTPRFVSSSLSLLRVLLTVLLWIILLPLSTTWWCHLFSLVVFEGDVSIALSYNRVNFTLANVISSWWVGVLNTILIAFGAIGLIQFGQAVCKEVKRLRNNANNIAINNDANNVTDNDTNTENHNNENIDTNTGTGTIIDTNTTDEIIINDEERSIDRDGDSDTDGNTWREVCDITWRDVNNDNVNDDVNIKQSPSFVEMRKSPTPINSNAGGGLSSIIASVSLDDVMDDSVDNLNTAANNDASTINYANNDNININININNGIDDNDDTNNDTNDNNDATGNGILEENRDLVIAQAANVINENNDNGNNNNNDQFDDILFGAGRGGDIFALQGSMKMMIIRWIAIIMFNAAFVFVLEVLPILIGKVIMYYVGLPLWIEESSRRTISTILDAHIELSNELVAHFDVTTDIPSIDTVWTGCLVLMQALLGYGFVSFVILVTYIVYAVTYEIFNHQQTPLISVCIAQAKHYRDTAYAWVKVFSILAVEAAIIPQLLGWLIGIISLKAFDSTLNQRLDKCYNLPVTCILIHWGFGLLFTLHMAMILFELRNSIKHDLLVGILPDISIQDFDENTLQLIANRSFSYFLRRTIINCCLYIPGVIFTFFIPFHIGHILCPFSQPMKIRLKEVELSMQLPMEMLMFHVVIPLMIERVQYRSAIRDLLKAYLSRACVVLDLTYLLDASYFPNPLPILIAENVRENVDANNDSDNYTNLVEAVNDNVTSDDNIHDSNNNIDHIINNHDEFDRNIDELQRRLQTARDRITDKVETVETVDETYKKSLDYFRHRIKSLPLIVRQTILVLIGLFILTFISCWALHTPLFIGRQLLHLLALPSDHDLYNFAAGISVCWGAMYLFQYFLKDVMQHAELDVIVKAVTKWTLITIKIIALGAIWLTIPPLLIGCLFGLVIDIPIRTPFDESPRYPFVQCWALGFIAFKIWTRCVLIGVMGDNIWRRRFDKVINLGLTRMDAMFILTDIIIPIIVNMLDLLVIPYFFARVMCLTIQSYALQTIIIRFSFLFYIILKIVRSGIQALHVFLVKVHNEIRDSRYLVGTELTNRSIH